MQHYNLAMVGFGNVGQALARLLLAKREELNARYHVTFSVVGIATRRHGIAMNSQGLDLERALAMMENGASLGALSSETPPDNAFEFIRRCGADVLFETTPVNYQNGQPAVTHLQLALEMGMHAITANKGPVVHAFRQLSQLAVTRGRKFYFESAVMDGAPIFSLFREALPAVHLIAFQGILNSTTNLMLTRMEEGETFERSLAYAQSIGITETDPSGDIDGWDAAIKVAALVTVLMDFPLTPHQVERQGIRQLTSQAVMQAKREGKRWKLVCRARRQGEGVQARVAPEQVLPTSPLYAVHGTSSLIQFETDVLSGLTVIESDPGPQTTAYGLLADFLNAVR